MVLVLQFLHFWGITLLGGQITILHSLRAITQKRVEENCSPECSIQ